MQKLSYSKHLICFKKCSSIPLSTPWDLERYLIIAQIMIHSYHVRWGHFPILPLEELMDAQNARQVCQISLACKARKCAQQFYHKKAARSPRIFSHRTEHHIEKSKPKRLAMICIIPDLSQLVYRQYCTFLFFRRFLF